MEKEYVDVTSLVIIESSEWFLVHLSNRLALTKVTNISVVPGFNCLVSVL